MNNTVARMLGEAEQVADASGQQPTATTPTEPAQVNSAKNPTVEQLLALWQQGQKEAVALRVLDALDRYADFLELAFRIGHDGALELGQIMDSMTSEEHSPHEYDNLPDTDIPSKLGKRPNATSDAHIAAGE